MASLKEIIKSHEQGIGSKLPLVLSEALVFKVGILELGTDVDGSLELFGGVNWFLFEECKDLSA